MKNNFFKELDIPTFLLSLFILIDYIRPIALVRLKIALLIQIVLIFYLFRNNIFSYIQKENSKLSLIFFLLLLFEMIINVFVAHNNFWALQFLKSTFSYFLIFVSMSIFINSINRIKIILFVFLFSNFYLAIQGIINGGMVPSNGFMADENDFALAMNIALPIGLYYSYNLRGKWKLIALSSLAFFFLGSAYSLSRGGMVGIIVVIFFIWLKSNKKLLSILSIFVALVIFIPNMPDGYKKELYSIFEEGGESGTGKERLEFWKVSWKMFLDNPILGVGQGNIPYRIGEYQESGIWKRGIGGRVVHSFYFTLIPELGLVGIVIIFFLLKYFFKNYRSLKNEISELKNLSEGIMISMVAFLITGAFLSVLYYPHFWMLIALMNMCYVNKNNEEVQYVGVNNYPNF